MKKCELCDSRANMYCESDQACLCWSCDSNVHGANFIVSKHSRTLLCNVCQSLTPWIASGHNLGPTVSLCLNCTINTRSVTPREDDDHDDDDDNDTGDDGLDDNHDDDDDDDNSDSGDGDDEDNQVVPLSSPPPLPPPVSSSSTSEESGICIAKGDSEKSNWIMIPLRRSRAKARRSIKAKWIEGLKINRCKFKYS